MANLLATAALWTDPYNLGTPPPAWNGTTYTYNYNIATTGVAINKLIAVQTADGDIVSGSVIYTEPTMPATIVIALGTTVDGGFTWVAQSFVTVTRGVLTQFSFPVPAGVVGLYLVDSQATTFPSAFYGLKAVINPAGGPAVDDLNCDCDCGFPSLTLAELLVQLTPLMGYSAQGGLSTSIRAAFVAQINLQQKLVVRDISEISSRRRFTWDAAIGDHKFCLSENLETCRNDLIATKISAVYWVGDGNVITRLDKGIDFQMYEAENPSSTPSRYDVRSCLEIWPKPTEAGKVVVEGTLAPTALAMDNDKVTVDPTALLLRCLAFLKVGKGHEDAGTYSGQYWDYIGGLVADESMDRRIIPRGFGTRRERLCDEERLTHHMEPRTYD